MEAKLLIETQDLAGQLQSILNLISIKDIVSILLFLFLVFLGVSARVMVEIERYDKNIKDIKLFYRYFIAIILAYILKLWFQNNSMEKSSQHQP